MEIFRALSQLGLQDTEARFYVAALELGEAPVRDVAEKAGISRTNAYDVFSRLRDQGLVSEVGGGNAKTIIVMAEPPEQLYAIFEQRRQRLRGLMPELNSLHVRSRSKPRVRYFQGLDGIKKVLNDTLSARSKLLFGILSMRDLYQVPGRAWMDDLVRRRIEAGVMLRVIRSQVNDMHAQWAQSEDELRQLRYAPADFVFSMTTYVYDEKVALISTQRESFAMTIESADFAAMQTHLFEALWATCTSARGATGKPRPRTAATQVK